ncbi:MAG: hypothetical protein B6D44_17655 [Ignavibacteriales bacterium UTCHB2]|jgi:hypothetical protein|nr:MAG: hypothetical protein B6D44_17655 [Ignavibacteriales bacterium UTCHB2]
MKKEISAFINDSFNNKLNEIPKEKLIGWTKKDIESLSYLYQIDVQKSYIFRKYFLIKSDNKINYRKKLNRLFAIDDFGDKDILNFACNESFAIIDTILLIDYNTRQDNIGINNELIVAHTIIKKNIKKRAAQNSGTILKLNQEIKNKIIKIANETRKENGKLNYSAIAREINTSNHTAKRLCSECSIQQQLN